MATKRTQTQAIQTTGLSRACVDRPRRSRADKCHHRSGCLQFGAKGPSGFVWRRAEVMFRTQSYSGLHPPSERAPSQRPCRCWTLGLRTCTVKVPDTPRKGCWQDTLQFLRSVRCSVPCTRATRNSSLCKPATRATLVDGGPTCRTRGTSALLSEGLHLTTSRLATFVYACMLKQDSTWVTLEVSKTARFTIKGRAPIFSRPSLLLPCCS